MVERLSPADAATFTLEGPSTPQHVGGLAVFEPAESGLDYRRLLRLLEERIGLAPRFRQKLRTVPGRLVSPVWVDDPDFDISFHVRRSVLPRPGSRQQLLDFCARIQTRHLDRSRPLWEVYLVEGLEDGCLAVITKTHEALVDGRSAIDLAAVILDAAPDVASGPGEIWMPEPEPSTTDLVLAAITELLRRPADAAAALRAGLDDVGAATGRVGALVRGGLSGVWTAATVLIRPEPSSPLTARPGEQRRVALALTELAAYREIRSRSGASINDVALATVAGCLRGWLLARGEAVTASTVVHALVPLSVDDPAGPPVTASVVELPVGEPDPMLRLARISFALAAHEQSGHSVSAETLISLGGFAPPTLHALGARAAAGLRRRMFSLVVANVPGPQQPRYAAGARLREMYPILPLGPGQALSVGLTSYDGRVFYGINADADAVPDVAFLAALVEESLQELAEASAVAGRTQVRPLVAGRRRARPQRRSKPPSGPRS